ncbi:MAG: hypothetical protein U0269_14785 [Polyangiales bacterium]
MQADEPKRQDDEDESLDRDAILGRRRVFISSAIAGLVLGACDRLPSPFACLSPAVIANADATVSTPPQPCLEITPTPCLIPRLIEEDASAAPIEALADAGPEAGSDVAPDAATTTRPQPCLRRAVPQPCLSRPRPCLRMANPTVCLDFKSKHASGAPDGDDGDDETHEDR